MIDKLRGLTCSVIHRLPRIKGVGVLSRNLNQMFLQFGCQPVVVANLKLGHKMIVDTRTKTESYTLYTGEYDHNKIIFLSSIMGKNSTFIDVGANIGFYTVPIACAAKKMDARIIAFEPLQANLVRLRENIRLNDIADVVEVFPYGLSSLPGTAQLTLREDFQGGGETGNASIKIDDGNDDKFEAVEITLKTLDEWINVIENVGIIKIDVEGHEDHVLRGGRNIINRDRPIIMIECGNYFYVRRGVDLYQTLFDDCLPPNYHAYRATGKNPFMGGDYFTRLEEINRLDEVGDAFLIPEEKRPFVVHASGKELF